MAFFIPDFFTGILFLLATLIVFVTNYFYSSYQYWKKKGVPTIQPRFPLGNANTLLPKAISLGTLSKVFYDDFKRRGCKFGGVYLVSRPNLVVVDPDYVKDILTKDFHHFVDRGFYYNEEKDPLSAHLFAIDSPKWKNLRVKLTPTFTSGKMKSMFWTVVECCDYMKEAIEASLDEDLEIKEFLGRYTTDVIGSCAFGIECNSFKYPDAEFRRMGKKNFNYTLWKSLKAFLILNQPDFSKKIGITSTLPELSEFFFRVVKDTVKMREDKGIRRNDFLQILIDMKKETGFSLEQMAAQVFLFFVAGFETSSSVMTFALYELAKNQHIQDKVRREIAFVSSKYDDKITYEGLHEMKYLNQVFEETLRMYPSIPTLTRRCIKEYTLRGTDVVIEKGTPLLIPALGLHMDPEYYPEPEVFDPERFSDENKKDRHPFVFLPFGEGPRNCIGLRFGQMQSKVGIATVIKNFKLTVSPENKPVEFNPYVFLLNTVDKVLLRAEKISK